MRNSNMSGMGSSGFSNMAGYGNKSSIENYRYVPDFYNDSLLSIPMNPAESETYAHSVAMSDASEWTLSAPTRAMGGPSSTMSRGTSTATSRRFVPRAYPESTMSGVSQAFSEASEWTLSGGNTHQIPALRGISGLRKSHHSYSPLPSPSYRMQLGQSNGLTGGFTRSAASNWTLSGGTGRVGAPSQRLSQASKALDDGRSIAFTDGGSEWALSPRANTIVRDDFDIGHSESAPLLLIKMDVAIHGSYCEGKSCS
jgi:hypothetical protein